MIAEPTHLGDMLNELEARVAFLSAAVGGLSCADDGMWPQRKAWEGLHLLVLDMEQILAAISAVQTPKTRPSHS